MMPFPLVLLQLRRLVAPEMAAQVELAVQAEREALAGTPPPHSPLPMQGEALAREGSEHARSACLPLLSCCFRASFAMRLVTYLQRAFCPPVQAPACSCRSPRTPRLAPRQARAVMRRTPSQMCRCGTLVVVWGFGVMG